MRGRKRGGHRHPNHGGYDTHIKPRRADPCRLAFRCTEGSVLVFDSGRVLVLGSSSCDTLLTDASGAFEAAHFDIQGRDTTRTCHR
jgi:hypothetical protein